MYEDEIEKQIDNPKAFRCEVPALLGIPLMVVQVEPLPYKKSGNIYHFDNIVGSSLTIEL